jgi:D-serine deaminase-like pyridoxal phosphate-dependent protein
MVYKHQIAIEKPTLLLDKDRATANIDRMVKKARDGGVRFRPHFKTHQSAEIGNWFRQRGITSITVSSVDMANYFAGYGWGDITVAFPVNLRQTKAINSLAERVNLNVLVESTFVAEQLSSCLLERVGVSLKIDCGYHRTGINWKDTEQVLEVARLINRLPNLELKGILTHSGHSYLADSREQVRKIYWTVYERMKAVQSQLANNGVEVEISVGDTPGCSLVEQFGEVDEVRPGNFIFYDLSQLRIGSCTKEQISVVLACPVVAIHPRRAEIVLYGGAIHLSKESIPGPSGQPIYGQIARLNSSGWRAIEEDSFVASLSQEHGIVHVNQNLLNKVRPGDVVAVVPVHSCLTANLMGRYVTLDGSVIDMLRL